MNPLEQIIREKIRKDGPIPFETFMDMALYHPELGYYASPESVIGRDGDFFTSPHLHPIFGAMIARQLYEMWQFTGSPPEFNIVEMGAGHGYLVSDIFEYIMKSEDYHDFLEAMHYVIVEPFAHFEKKQQAALGDTLSLTTGRISAGTLMTPDQRPIKWVKSLMDLDGLTGCLLSNELLDAFPVHLVRMGETPREIYVNHDDSNFIEEFRDVTSSDITDYLRLFTVPSTPGYRTEVNLKIKKWLEDASAILREGFILTIDYGYSAKEYYSDDRTGGTLLCYHRHTLNDSPYRNIGKQDITAHVNFSSLKVWGDELGLKTVGYCPQGTFLTAAGIDEVIVECYSDAADYLSELSKIKRLIFPQGLGESHNVMVQYKGDGAPQLRGFSIRNNVDRL